MNRFSIGRPESKRVSGLALGALLLVVSFSAEAQQRAGEHARIGFLWASALGSNAALKPALKDLGYIEGRNITIEYRYAQGKLDRLPELAADLVRLKVDVIVGWFDSDPCC
jgi:putative tryptophan/tyrosine transport system substrate-binding protein